MQTKDNNKIVALRNETSLCLDDLVALVVNSTLAYELRNFSSEVMELTPGFTFNLKQAQELRNLTQKTFKQYKSGAINDVALMEYQTNANTILKGDTIQTQNGGNKVGLFDKFLHGKEIKKKEAMDKLEQDYKKLCAQIIESQEKMNACVEKSRGQNPDSPVYRQNVRIYSMEKNRLTLLENQEANLRKLLEEADKIQLVKEFTDQQKNWAANSALVFGKDTDRAALEVAAEMANEQMKEMTSRVENFGEGLFASAAEENAARNTSTDFDARVAEAERMQATQDFANAVASMPQQQKTSGMSEFDALVKAAEMQTEK